MLPASRSTTSRGKGQHHLTGRLVISGTTANLDKLEQEAGIDKKVGKNLGTDLVPAPLRDTTPEAYTHDGKSWQKAILQGRQATDFASRKAARHQLTSAKDIVTRRYSFDPAKTAKAFQQPNQPTERAVVDELHSFLNNPPSLDGSTASFDVAVDHIFRHTIGAWPGGSPADIPARTGVPVNGLQPEQIFEQQAFWGTIGADAKARKEFKGQGAGVTVVIFDTAPALAKINPKLVDYYIAMKMPEGEIEPPNPTTTVPAVKERYSLARPNPLTWNEKPRPGGADVDHDLMQPYHGLLIASLIRELAPKVTIILLEVLDDNGETSGSNLTEAIEYILFLKENQVTVGGKRVVNDKVVLNLSLGYGDSLAEEVDVVYLLKTCEQAAQAGALIVASAGNDSYYLHPRHPEEPAAYGYYCDDTTVFKQVIAVAATANPGEYMPYSNQGNLAAPGMDLLMDTGVEDNPAHTRYVYWAGTSFAAPLVSASAALLLSNNVPVADVKQRLWKGANKYEEWNKIPDLNIGNALKA
jgi:hypothetical protein